MTTDCCGFAGETLSLTINADFTAPIPNIISSFDTYTNNPNPTFQVSSNEPEAILLCWRDYNDFFYCDSTVAFSNLSEGDHILEVVAVDRAGNQSDFFPYYFVNDYTPPVINAINGKGRFGTCPYRYTPEFIFVVNIQNKIRSVGARSPCPLMAWEPRPYG